MLERSTWSRWRGLPAETGIPTLWCFLMRQYEAKSGTEMNSRVQLPICFSALQWNGHRSTFVLCKTRKYAHTIFIGTDCIMNRPPSSRFADHSVVAQRCTLLHLTDWNTTNKRTAVVFPCLAYDRLCFLTNYFLQTCLSSTSSDYRFINNPNKVIASSLMGRSSYFEHIILT